MNRKKIVIQRHFGKHRTTEKTVTLYQNTDNTYNGVLINKGQGIGFLRLFRGTTTGTYTEYVDIPITGASFVQDNGIMVDGYYWQPVTSATQFTDEVDDLNSFIVAYYEFNNSNSVIHAKGVTLPTDTDGFVAYDTYETYTTKQTFNGTAWVTNYTAT